jgi:hypothetical protein
MFSTGNRLVLMSCYQRVFRAVELSRWNGSFWDCSAGRLHSFGDAAWIVKLRRPRWLDMRILIYSAASEVNRSGAEKKGSSMEKWKHSVRVAAILLLIVQALASEVSAAQGSAKIVALRGTVICETETGLWRPVQIGQTLTEGAVIQTAAGAEIDLDLDLGKNRSLIALNGGSTLKLARLDHTESLIGVVAQTSLELQEGTMVGKVQKQTSGSVYEVQTPTSTATVKGTEFYMSAKTGEIHVISGTVALKLKLDINRATGGGILPGAYAKEITIRAGQSFFMPKIIISPAAFKSIRTTPTEGWVTEQYLKRAQFLHYDDERPHSKVGVKETFTAKFVYRRKLPPMAIVDWQPTVAIVSP